MNNKSSKTSQQSKLGVQARSLEAVLAQHGITLKHTVAMDVLAKIGGNLTRHSVVEAKPTFSDRIEAIKGLPTAYRSESRFAEQTAEQEGLIAIPHSWGFLGTPQHVRLAEAAAEAAVINAIDGYDAEIATGSNTSTTYEAFHNALTETLRTGIMGFCSGGDSEPRCMAGNLLVAHILHAHGANALDEHNKGEEDYWENYGANERKYNAAVIAARDGDETQVDVAAAIMMLNGMTRDAALAHVRDHVANPD